MCVIATVAVDIRPFAEVDAAFAYDYGEWDRTLQTWRTHYWEINARRFRASGMMPTPAMPLVCERFVVVYRSAAPGTDPATVFHHTGRRDAAAGHRDSE